MWVSILLTLASCQSSCFHTKKKKKRFLNPNLRQGWSSNMAFAACKIISREVKTFLKNIWNFPFPWCKTKLRDDWCLKQYRPYRLLSQYLNSSQVLILIWSCINQPFKDTWFLYLFSRLQVRAHKNTKCAWVNTNSKDQTIQAQVERDNLTSTHQISCIPEHAMKSIT